MVLAGPAGGTETDSALADQLEFSKTASCLRPSVERGDLLNKDEACLVIWLSESQKPT
ncbi:hypothetical protein PGT21_021810 [Puccinia graminis f. sp. tritici]|uniref:Uncharacterized protein n=1 Tax=Puccinia graminis f. sp. tritici TaxID=56615 RepID=A0A5B0QWA9_PUCGR|nr:hypothetical protein PGT21_021810 [Puccinia graminis f. sp. tritici]KAA1117193.1 hypothetical protein PGTUg99_036891 [Puccinia graminis f. sp. tritici]